MGIAVTGNLGQVSHTQYLVVTLMRQPPQFAADHAPHTAPNSLVDFTGIGVAENPSQRRTLAHLIEVFGIGMDFYCGPYIGHRGCSTSASARSNGCQRIPGALVRNDSNTAGQGHLSNVRLNATGCGAIRSPTQRCTFSFFNERRAGTESYGRLTQVDGYRFCQRMVTISCCECISGG